MNEVRSSCLSATDHVYNFVFDFYAVLIMSYVVVPKVTKSTKKEDKSVEEKARLTFFEFLYHLLIFGEKRTFRPSDEENDYK